MTRELSLQPRLALLASLVPQGAVLADVGTDHAYLPAALIQEGTIPAAIAADLTGFLVAAALVRWIWGA